MKSRLEGEERPQARVSTAPREDHGSAEVSVTMSLLSFLSSHRVQGKMLLLQGVAASRRHKYHLEGVPAMCPCVPRPFRRKLCPLPSMSYLHFPPSPPDSSIMRLWYLDQSPCPPARALSTWPSRSASWKRNKERWLCCWLPTHSHP